MKSFVLFIFSSLSTFIRYKSEVLSQVLRAVALSPHTSYLQVRQLLQFVPLLHYLVHGTEASSSQLRHLSQGFLEDSVPHCQSHYCCFPRRSAREQLQTQHSNRQHLMRFEPWCDRSPLLYTVQLLRLPTKNHSIRY